MRKPNAECKVCLAPIYRRPLQIESGNIFCSLKCKGKSCRKGELKTCICGVEISARRSSCSRKCSNARRAGITYRIGQPKNRAEQVKRLKRSLIELKGPKCERCPYDFVEILNVHHIIARKDGGSDELSNLELICPNCHAEEHYHRSVSRNIL